ncbi:MAG: peptidoglycan-binding protein, partial [Patescibacteria group bacterium]|nr:peptidoglycan-binding protein [Patescibacteria group bacterium]
GGSPVVVSSGGGGGGSPVISSGGGGTLASSSGAGIPVTSTLPIGGACVSSTTITKPAIPSLLLTLSLGDRGPNVVTLQNYLIRGGFLPADDNTGFYGPLTRAAVGAYIVAPATLVRTVSCQPAVSAGAHRLATTFQFQTILHWYTTTADVKNLQIFLNDHGYTVSTAGAGSVNNETPYFGPATIKALSKFQAANNISPAIGNFGPITKGYVNQMIGAGK